MWVPQEEKAVRESRDGGLSDLAGPGRGRRAPGPAVHEALAPWLATGRVALRGHVPWEAMPAEYAAGDIFLFPSSLETQGLATLEAMAAGLPVVAVQAGALPELVRDGESGITAPAKVHGSFIVFS
ncbi:MAG TPA: glycosyltransferase [Symbiobacteriaceae bacterium]